LSCFSLEAIRSLKIFQNIYAEREGMRGLECEIPSTMLAVTKTPAIATTSTPGTTKKLVEEYEANLEEMAGRKARFMDRLLIRRVGTVRAPRMSNKSRKSSGKSGCDEENKWLICPS